MVYAGSVSQIISVIPLCSSARLLVSLFAGWFLCGKFCVWFRLVSCVVFMLVGVLFSGFDISTPEAGRAFSTLFVFDDLFCVV